jgi:hypothetical protein
MEESAARSQTLQEQTDQIVAELRGEVRGGAGESSQCCA